MSTSKVPKETGKAEHPTIQRKPPGSFHHGTLADSIVDAATTIIRERGSADFSLREISVMAGVSHTAAYRHFRSKGDVIAEIATRGFRTLAASLEASTVRAHDGSIDAIETMRNMAEQYLAFAAANPGTYRVLFHAEVCNRSLYPQLAEAAEATYTCLASTIGEALARRLIKIPQPSELLASALWSALHGHAILLIDRQIAEHAPSALIVEGSAPPADRNVLIALLLDALFRP